MESYFTIRKGIIDITYFVDVPHYLVLGMISALLSAGRLAVAPLLRLAGFTTHSTLAQLWFYCYRSLRRGGRMSKVGGIVEVGHRQLFQVLLRTYCT